MRRWMPAVLLAAVLIGRAHAQDCTNPDLPPDSPCDDGDACTQVDRCEGTVCVGSVPVECTASDDCHVAGTCDPATGFCSDPPAENGTACDDGDACTQVDTCTAGACLGASPLECTATDACHVAGTCNPATGACSNPAAPNGTSCNDGDACTQVDSCTAGTCLGASPVVCTASDACHVAGTCNPATGACSNPAAPNGTSCNDGDACTQVDACTAGTCLGASPVVCAASDACHVAGTCNPATGACSNPAAPNGTFCDDGDACTQVDACAAGTCLGSSLIECTASDACHVAGTCNPATGACSNPAAPDDTPCDDGDACTQVDACTAGTCLGASPVVCAASDACHVAGTCNPATGACSNPAAPNGTSCDDGDACTQVDACAAGTCLGSSLIECTASDACHVAGTCDPATGACSNPAAPDDTPCDDGDACTQVDACTAGACLGASPVVCTAGDACHVAGTCDSATGACSNPAAPDDTSCDDGRFCTVDDRCQSAVCGGAPRNCAAAGDTCNDGICDESGGRCAPLPKTGTVACDDGDRCTQVDRCSAGACVGSAPVTCTARDACHLAGTCDPGTGLCGDPTAPDETSCDDGRFCTVGDACHGGVCTAGAPRDCTAAGNACNDGICDEDASRCAPQAKPGTPACDDGDACTQVDRCADGLCVGAAPVQCTARDDCHAAGTCNPSTGVCTDPLLPERSDCDDRNACTTADLCRNGVCGGSRLPGCCIADAECNDGTACTDDRCVDAACIHTPLHERCGDGGECARAVCAPREPGADTSGCVLTPVPETFCTEDEDPCTTDACRGGACMHDPAGPTSDCGRLSAPLAAAVVLRGRTEGMRVLITSAANAGCSVVGQTGCDVVGGSDGPAPRLLDLLAEARADLDAAIAAMGGRLAQTPGAVMRARLALAFLDGTPDALRAFRGTITTGRSHHMISPVFARARRAEAIAILRATTRLRTQLKRVTANRRGFAR